MQYSIKNPPKKFQNNPVELEAWKTRFRARRRAREKRQRTGTTAAQMEPLEHQAKATELMWSSRKRAQRKKLEWSLSIEWIRQRLVNGCCEETGIPFDMSVGNRRQKPFAPSLDRKDCSVGYTENNTKVVVWIHNCAKMDWGTTTLHHYIKQYLKHLALSRQSGTQ